MPDNDRRGRDHTAFDVWDRKALQRILDDARTQRRRAEAWMESTQMITQDEKDTLLARHAVDEGVARRLQRYLTEAEELDASIARHPAKGKSEPQYGWQEWELDPSTDAIPDKYLLTIVDPDGEEVAVIIHRTCDGRYPLDGSLAKRKVSEAQAIVDALNNHREEGGLTWPHQ